MLREQRIQLAIYPAERARAFLHQGRSTLDGLGAGHMRDVRVAASVDSADRDHVEKIFALAKKSMRLRKYPRPALHNAGRDIDFEIFRKIVGADRDRDSHRLEQIGD